MVFRPYFWLSSEFFAADGYPGIAIPFYLAHPRLAALERRQMLEVEGGTRRSLLKILRQETGHTLESAYRLNRRSKWRELFGSGAMKYPKFYQPKPYSRNYVIHLDMWYAQSHPSEDFAETFAVWLRPGSRWKQRYAGWGALRKLEYVDELMKQIGHERPPIRRRRFIDPLSSLKQTLREHYDAKRATYAKSRPTFYDNDLRKLFSDDPRATKNPRAADFLRTIKPELRTMIARWTGEYRYTIDRALADIIERCRELRLHLARSPRRTRTDALVMLTVQTMNFLHAGHHRVAL
jgi:hypothetical protein